MVNKIIIYVWALLLAAPAIATVKLPGLVSNGMVLQRHQPLLLWGWANPQEAITLHFLGHAYKTNTDNAGRWQVILPACAAGGPYSMTITGENSITISNILIGDVWLCSGQSNMEYSMGKLAQRYRTEMAAAQHPQIRQFLVKRNVVFTPANDVQSDGWVAASPATIPEFTAVGYFFALKLFEKYRVPIGLINSTYGGTPAEAWTGSAGLQDFPAYAAIAERYRDSAQLLAKIAHDKAYVNAWHENVQRGDQGASWVAASTDATNWATINMPSFWGTQWLKGHSGVVYFRKEIEVPAEAAGKDAVLFLGKLREQDSTYFNGVKVGSTASPYTPRKYIVPGRLVKAGRNVIAVRVLSTIAIGGFDPYNPNPYQLVCGTDSIPLAGLWKYKAGVGVDYLRPDSITAFHKQPTVLFNGMIAPLIPYAIKGVIWYQGEDNVSKAREYRSLFPALINNWRAAWKQKELPFLFVQLANFQAPSPLPSEGNFAELREAQSMALALPATGMAVTHDIGQGDDIHPQNKKDVGIRLALLAAYHAYHDKQVVCAAPSYQSMKVSGHKAVVYFKDAASGLVAKDGQPLRHFAVAGADRNYVWAKAVIEGDHVVVCSDAVPHPVAVRYAWANNPEGANLFNTSGLPVSLFRTDDWQPLTR